MQAGRELLLAGAALSGGATLDVPFYDVSLTLVRPRVPTVVLASGCGRYDGCAAPLVPEGDMLLLLPSHALVERSAHVVDFASAAPRAPAAGAVDALAEGDVLALQPSHEAVLPAHPTLVKLPPRRRVRRQRPTITVNDTVLCEIEAEIAHAQAEVRPPASP